MLSEIRYALHILDDLRGQAAEMIRNLPSEALNWRPELPEGADPTNSLAVLAVHIAGSEHYWIGELLGGLPPTRDRDAEFAYLTSSSEEPIQRLKDVGEESRAVLSALSEDDLATKRERKEVMIPVRWIIFNTVHHTALHLGHMEITYQLWNQGVARSSPSLNSRIPND